MSKRYLAMLDILGFSDLVDKNNHSELENIFHDLGINIKNSIADNNDRLIFKSDGSLVAIPDTQNYTIGIHVFVMSDTIMLWSDDATGKQFVNLLLVVGSLFCYTFKLGLPLRGAITYGDLDDLNKKKGVADRLDVIAIHTVFGKAMIEAHQLEKKQNWAGCIIAESAINNYAKDCKIAIKHNIEASDIDYLKKIGMILDYKVPMKYGEIKTLTVINWPTRVNKQKNNALTKTEVKNSFSKFKKEVTTWDAQYKVDNTLAFYDYVIKNFYIKDNIKLKNSPKIDNKK